MQLLTPLEVSKKLKISLSTVYKKSRILGGFYPAGIKSLRFDEAIINGIMERSRQMAFSFHVSGTLSHGERFFDQSGSKKSSRKKKGRSKEYADSSRHGL